MIASSAKIGVAAGVPYTGGKSQSGVWQRIINLIPPHDVYVEPFLGSGAIMRLKKPAAKNIARDLVAPKMALGVPCDFKRACGIEFLESYKFTGTEFVYCDPPYVLSARGNRRHYLHEMSDAQHERLLRVVRDLPCRVLISGYRSGIYDRALRGWNREEFEVMTRGHTWATEVLWFNYPRPLDLHDLAHVGTDYRDRWRIEKRRRRWRARLQKMPALERATLFSALVDVMGLVAGGSATNGAGPRSAAANAETGATRDNRPRRS
jgi:DNA adenine methylase